MTIRCGETEYPCYPTMGAAVGFKEQTGRDIEEMHGTADFAVYIYCCAKSASRREGKDFTLSIEEFSDGVLIEDLTALNTEMATSEDPNTKKKG